MANQATIDATPGGYEIVIMRDFDAPIEKVWRAYTDPELVVQWLGPKRLKGRVDSWEMKSGGLWELTHIDEDGSEYGFHGYVHDVAEHERISRTFEYHGWPGHASFETAYFEDLGNGKTRLRAVSVFQSPEDRDGMISSSMEKGVTEGNERLDELLKTI